jgi:hypothetical protein
MCLQVIMLTVSYCDEIVGAVKAAQKVEIPVKITYQNIFKTFKFEVNDFGFIFYFSFVSAT